MVDIKVPNIMCQSCCDKIKASLEKAGVQAEIDLRFKLVSVDDKDVEAARKAIEDAGYTAE